MSDTPRKLDPGRVLNELLMARTQCLALVRNIELILTDLGVMLPSDGIDRLRVPSDPVPDPDDSGGCRHPMGTRRRAPVMGMPNRFMCSACGEVVNSDEAI